jgi:hypothetical protein
VNSSIKFGPRVCPIRGFGACYHPDKEWLIENGLCPDKAKCIEINDGKLSIVPEDKVAWTVAD